MRETIFIVDDLQFNIDMLTSILVDKYDVVSAKGGEQALDMLMSARRKPDLILLDIYMSGKDGFEVIKAIKSREGLANIPVIFVTAACDSHIEEKGLLLGAADYISRPFSPPVVRARIRSHLELKTYREHLEHRVRDRIRGLEERTRLLEAQNAQICDSNDALIMCMSFITESRECATGGHVRRVKRFTELMTDKLLAAHPQLLSADEARQTVKFSPLHDIGKISVPDAILTKAGKLTNEEYLVIKGHTKDGAHILRELDEFLSARKAGELTVAMSIAECHHEHFDGSGYPDGLSGRDIPLPARIVALADVYDALRSSRPYKKACTHDEAVSAIVSGDGRTSPKHFDPLVLDMFLKNCGEFEKIYI